MGFKQSVILSLCFAGACLALEDFRHGRQQQYPDERVFVEYDDYLDVSAPRQEPAAQPPLRTRGPTNNRQQSPQQQFGGGGGGGGGDCRQHSLKLPHEKYCDLYYVTTGCSDSEKLTRACPNGLVFGQTGRSFGLVDSCDYPHNVNCGEKTLHNPPISTEHCDWLYGIFGHETSCTRYWTCWNGTATEQFCVGGLLYNEETHACDWPQNVGGCQKHPLCKDDANGNVPLGKSCNRYWACQGGYPRLQRCPAMLVFDKKRRRCISPPTEDCDVPSTTPTPEGEGQNNNDFEDEETGPREQRPVGNRRRSQVQNLQDDLPFQLPGGASLINRPDQLN